MNRDYQKKKIGELDIIEIPGDPELGTIVLLHGFGADALDLFPLHSLFKGPTWIFPKAPLQVQIAPGYFGRAWFPVDIEKLIVAIRENRLDAIAGAFPPEIHQATKLIEDLIERLEIPRSKLILGGFSQGAILAIEAALTHPDPCRSLLIFSGTLINEPIWKRQAPSHATTSFFQSHGFHDPLLPFQNASDLEKLLIEGGLAGKMHRFEGGHEIPQSILLKLSAFLTLTLNK